MCGDLLFKYAWNTFTIVVDYWYYPSNTVFMLTLRHMKLRFKYYTRLKVTNRDLIYRKIALSEKMPDRQLFDGFY